MNAKTAAVLGAGMVIAAALALPSPVAAQVEIGPYSVAGAVSSPEIS